MIRRILLVAMFCESTLQCQSLQETLDWLASRMSGVSIEVVDTHNTFIKAPELKWLDNDKCNVVFGEFKIGPTARVSNDEWKKLEHRNEMYFAHIIVPVLRLLDLGSMSVSGSTIEIGTDGGQPLIGAQRVTKHFVEDRNRWEIYSEDDQQGRRLRLYAESNAMAERIAKALTRAGQLCGAPTKGEPF